MRGRRWGTDRYILKMLYTGLIHSVIDYGCIICGSAAKTLKKLHTIQYQVLRLWRSDSVTGRNELNAIDKMKETVNSNLVG